MGKWMDGMDIPEHFREYYIIKFCKMWKQYLFLYLRYVSHFLVANIKKNECMKFYVTRKQIDGFLKMILIGETYLLSTVCVCRHYFLPSYNQKKNPETIFWHVTNYCTYEYSVTLYSLWTNPILDLSLVKFN